MRRLSLDLLGDSPKNLGELLSPLSDERDREVFGEFLTIHRSLSDYLREKRIFSDLPEPTEKIATYESVHSLSLSSQIMTRDFGGCSSTFDFGRVDYYNHLTHPAVDFNLTSKKLINCYGEGKRRFKDLEFYKSTDPLMAFFSWLVLDIDGWLDGHKELDKLRRRGDALEIVVQDSLFRGRKLVKKFSGVRRYTHGDMVGNEELMKTLTSAAKTILLYDPKTKRNWLTEKMGAIPKHYLITGPPGTGKTLANKIIADYISRMAEEADKPYELVNITNAFKGSFVNESVKNFIGIFQKIASGDKIYYVTIEDIGTIIFNRSALRNHPEERKIIGEFLNYLDGSNSLPYDNYIISATENDGKNQDMAVLSRMHKITALGPRTVEDYYRIFQVKLRKGIKNGYVNVKDWRTIGRLSKSIGLSGRDISQITSELIRDAMPEIDESDFTKSFSELDKELLPRVKPITLAKVIEKVREYDERKRKAERNFLAS